MNGGDAGGFERGGVGLVEPAVKIVPAAAADDEDFDARSPLIGQIVAAGWAEAAGTSPASAHNARDRKAIRLRVIASCNKRVMPRAKQPNSRINQ